MNGRPAGMSSSDEDELDVYATERPKKNHQYEPRILTPDEKLIDAVWDNDVNAVKEALGEGANIHHRSISSMNHSPIMHAANFGCFEVMECLIEHGANVNDDHEMFTVLMCLCDSYLRDESILLKCLNLLLDSGADPLATDSTGTTPLMKAVRWYRQLLAAKLLESGCSVNAADGHGWTPLFYAVQAGSVRMTKFLIDSGGDINVKDRFGATLWEHAAPKNDKDLSALVTPKELLETYEYTPDQIPYSCTSQFKLMMATGPKTDDRSFGFHEEAVSFLRGIELHNVASEMEKRKIQFSELMTWDQQDWIRAGVQLSYPLKKIALCVRKYHEREWCKGSIPNVAHVVSKENVVDLFSVVQVLLSCLRNVHVCSASSLYMLKNYEGPMSRGMEDELKNILKTMLIVKRQVRLLKAIIREIDNPTLYPSDRVAKHRESEFRKSIKCFIVKRLCWIVDILLYEWFAG